MAGDYRSVIMILHYLLGITPSVVIITDWIKKGEVICVWKYVMTVRGMQFGIMQVYQHSVAYQPLPGLSCLYRPVGVLRSKNVGE